LRDILKIGPIKYIKMSQCLAKSTKISKKIQIILKIIKLFKNNFQS
jgi:hypothetical protein